MNLDKKLLSVYIQAPELFGKSLKEVDSEFFKPPYSKIHSLLKTYYIKYKKLPSIDMLEQQLFRQKDKLFDNSAQADDIILGLRAETTLTDKNDYEFLSDEQ